MRLVALLATIAVAACVLTEIHCITNQEFFDLVKDSAEDLESFDLDDPAINDDDDEDAIELPGNPDDELDLGYLITKLDMEDVMNRLEKAAPKQAPDNLGWWRRRRRRRRKPWHNPCSCRGLHCNCCMTKTFKINLWFKKYRFRVSVCVNVGYNQQNRGFYFTVTFNNRRVFHREISVRHPPAICYPVPGISRFVRGCIEIYNVNLGAKSMCLKLVAIIDIKVKKFKYGIKIGCFKIPMMDALEAHDFHRLLENMEASVENKETGAIEEVSMNDIPLLYRQLQIEAAEKYMEVENESESS